jgi:competence protein ComEC
VFAGFLMVGKTVGQMIARGQLTSKAIGNVTWLERLKMRPMLALAIPALAGALMATRPLGRILCLGILMILAVASGRLHRHSRLLLLTALAFALAAGRSGLIYGPADRFARQHAGQFWTGEGQVVKHLYVSNLSSGVAQVHAVLKIEHGVQLAVTGPQAMLPIGSRIRVSGHLNHPDQAANPGGFDSRDWLWRQGVLLVLKQLPGDPPTLVVPPVDRLDVWLEQAASRLRADLVKASVRLVGKDLASLLVSLLIGDTSGLAKEQLYHFRQAGLSHLTAVSGANIAFWLGPLDFVLRRFKLPRQSRQGALLAFLAGFGLLTGWPASVNRAIIMAGLILFGKLFHRRPDPLNSLGFAALLFIMIRPTSVLGYGFWLSSLATFALLAGAPVLEKRLLQHWPWLPKPIAELLSLNLSVQALVLPVSLILTRQINLVGLIANPPAALLVEWITVVALILLPGLGLMTALTGGKGLDLQGHLALPLQVALNGLERLAISCSRIDSGRLPVANLNGPLLAALAILVVLMVWRARLKTRVWLNQVLAVCLCSGLAIQFMSGIWRHYDRIWFLSVGQGDATLIQTRSRETILIDSGKLKSGWDVLLPTLDALGIRRINQLILTHGHQDHAGGAVDLLQSGRVDQLVVGNPVLESPESDDYTQELLRLAEEQGLNRQFLANGGTIFLNHGQDRLDVLTPDGLVSNRSVDLNEWALHFQLTIRDQAILLMSDCTEDVETGLVRQGKLRPSKVLKVAHHGSASTTRAEFLDQVQPDFAVISVGYNSYGHPSPELLERLTRRSIEVARTDWAGAVLLTVHSEGMQATKYK